MKNKDLINEKIDWAKRSKIIAPLALICLLLIFLGHVTDALDKIISFPKKHFTEKVDSSKKPEQVPSIAYAVAWLEIEIEKTELSTPPAEKPLYGFVCMHEKKPPKTSLIPFISKTRPVYWGNKGGISRIEADFVIDDRSSLVGKPISYFDNLGAFKVVLFTNIKEMHIIKGKFSVVLNGSIRKEYEITSQKVDMGEFYIELPSPSSKE